MRAATRPSFCISGTLHHSESISYRTRHDFLQHFPSYHAPAFFSFRFAAELFHDESLLESPEHDFDSPDFTAIISIASPIFRKSMHFAVQ